MELVTTERGILWESLDVSVEDKYDVWDQQVRFNYHTRMSNTYERWAEIDRYILLSYSEVKYDLWEEKYNISRDTCERKERKIH